MIDSGLLAALGDQRAALFVYLLLRQHVEGGPDPTRPEDGPVSLRLTEVDAQRVLRMDARSVRRHVARLDRFGWVLRRGHTIELGRWGKRGTRFFFDAWLATHVGKTSPTGSRRKVEAEVEAMRAALAAPTPDWNGPEGARCLALAVAPPRYVSLDLADPLLGDDEGRGVVLLAACLSRFAFVPSFQVGRTAGRRKVRVGQALLAAVLGVHETTIRRWVTVAAAHGRIEVMPQGIRRRNVYAVRVPTTRVDVHEDAAEIGRISRAAGSSDAMRTLLERWGRKDVRPEPSPARPRPDLGGHPPQDGHQHSPSLTIPGEEEGSVSVGRVFF
ncbi:MAG: hypothetical protein KC619_17490 [Myxococcales bacterium]|nr:hypothetical protein [Myxococcales bacterium]